MKAISARRKVFETGLMFATCTDKPFFIIPLKPVSIEPAMIAVIRKQREIHFHLSCRRGYGKMAGVGGLFGRNLPTL